MLRADGTVPTFDAHLNHLDSPRPSSSAPSQFSYLTPGRGRHTRVRGPLPTSRTMVRDGRDVQRRRAHRSSSDATCEHATDGHGPRVRQRDASPTPRRSGAALAVVDRGAWILVDSGRGVTQRALDAGLDLTEVIAVLSTHHHSDRPRTHAATCLSIFDETSLIHQSDPGAGPSPTIWRRGLQRPTSFGDTARLRRLDRHSALVDHHPSEPAVGRRIERCGVVITVSGDTAVSDGMHVLSRRGRPGPRGPALRRRASGPPRRGHALISSSPRAMRCRPWVGPEPSVPAPVRRWVASWPASPSCRCASPSATSPTSSTGADEVTCRPSGALLL